MVRNRYAQHMKFTLHLPERPFNAIKNGTKKIEGRVPKTNNSKYHKMRSGDMIDFQLEPGKEILHTKIVFVHHYGNFRDMLETEGVQNVLSSEPKTIEHGIELYNSLTKYKENVKKYGVFAIGIQTI